MRPVRPRAVVLIAALVLAAPAAAFTNGASDAAQQWYLDQDQAWNYWPTQPVLAPVKVAVIDSGIDAGDPAFAGRIAAGRSFVGGTWSQDTNGHGTFVAGEIAATPVDGQGISGLAFNAKLFVAKVVEPDGSVDLRAEVAAIRWAANEGARVINLSLGGLRDPLDAGLDTYSPAEFAAVEYAYSKGAVIVAAVGNGSEAPSEPWPYADYPAALPHVIGVAALNENGSVPDFSNRDAVYVDLAAPGADIFSTVPRNLVDSNEPGCTGVAYSTCGPLEFRDAIGTSFAAPQVSAAAALLLGVDPSLTPDQVSWLLERSARDVDAATGCPFCPSGRDKFTGWGRLDVDAALRLLSHRSRLPAPDIDEPNNDIPFAHPFGPAHTLTESLDFGRSDRYLLRTTSRTPETRSAPCPLSAGSTQPHALEAADTDALRAGSSTAI